MTKRISYRRVFVLAGLVTIRRHTEMHAIEIEVESSAMLKDLERF